MRHRVLPAIARGLTLIETCCMLAVAGIVLAGGLPSMDESLAKRRFVGVVDEVMAELQFARSAAPLQPTGAWLKYSLVQGGTCSLIHTGARDDCSCGDDGAPVCVEGAQALKAAVHRVPVSMARPIHFSSTNGTVAPTATITLHATNGAEVRHVVNIMGRVKTCSPESRVTGYKPC